jgi:hypothetical protein
MLSDINIKIILIVIGSLSQPDKASQVENGPKNIKSGTNTDSILF